MKVDAALEYAARGWPVLACRPRAKAPLLEHGLHDATTDPDTIRQWWKQWPDAELGLRTGVAFDVLDVDGDEGVDEPGLLLGGDEALLPTGPAAFTPNRGVHLFFAPSGIGNRARFRPGLDWRGDGGYVLVAPSVGANGIPYRWWDIGDGLHLDTMPTAPGWLVELLAPASPSPVQRAAPVGVGTGDRYARAAVVDEVRRVANSAVGARNHTLNTAAYNLGQLVGAGLLDALEVFERLLGAALQAGLGDREARRTIRSGLEAGLQHPRSVAS